MTLSAYGQTIDDFEFNVGDFFPISDYHMGSLGGGTDFNAAREDWFKIVSKSTCDQCKVYVVKGVNKQGIQIEFDSQGSPGPIKYDYYPYTDTLYFCANNPSGLRAFWRKIHPTSVGPDASEYGDPTISPGYPQQITAAQDAYLNASYPDNTSPLVTTYTLPNTSVYAGLPGGTFLGRLGADVELETVCGVDDDNEFFFTRRVQVSILDAETYLYLEKPLDYQLKTTYRLHVRIENGQGRHIRTWITINALDGSFNHQPTDLKLSTLEVPLSVAFSYNQFIANIIPTDEDANDTYTFKLVPSQNSIAKSKDNMYLRIDGNRLLTFGPPLVNYTMDSLNLSIQAFDGINGVIQKDFTLKVTKETNCLAPVVKQSLDKLTATVVQPVLTYMWYRNSVKVEEASSTLTINSGGTYTVVAYYTNGCIATSNPFITNGPIPPPLKCDETALTANIYWNSHKNNSTELVALLYSPNGAVDVDTLAIAWQRDGIDINVHSSDFIAEQPGSYTYTGDGGTCHRRSDPFIISKDRCYLPTILADGTRLQSTFGVSFKWYLDGAEVGSDDHFDVTSPGSYEVEVTYETGCVVKSNPYIIYTLGTDCFKPLVTFNGTSLVSTTGTSYQWFKDGASIGSQQTVTPTGAGTYKVTVGYSNGCSQTSADFIADACSFDLAKIHEDSNEGIFVASPIDAANTYEWYANGTLVTDSRALNSNYPAQVTPQVPGEYHVLIKFPGGCERTSNSLIRYYANGQCLPSDIQINGLALTFIMNTGIYPSFTWVRNGVGIDSFNDELFVTQPGIYTLETDYYVTSDSRVTCVSAPVEFDFIGSDCLAPTITRQGRNLYASTTGDYSWFLNGQDLMVNTVGITPLAVGQYTVKVKYPNGCEKESDPVTVTDCDVSNSTPTPTISHEINTLTSSTADSYNWFLNGVALDLHTQSIVATSTGTYTVEAKYGDCSNASEGFVVDLIILGLEEEIISSAFPNPSDGMFQITSASDIGEVSVVIFNASGQRIHISSWDTNHDLSVDLTKESAGLYLARFTNGSKTWTQRLMRR
jgi:hypothetical protein